MSGWSKLASILALRPDNGDLIWYYQTTPGETWDYTATQHMILANLEINGRLRKVLMQAPKNSVFYVLDRATGELISAQPYVKVTWDHGVDLTSGRPIEAAVARYESGPTVIFPSALGGHHWMPMSFNPHTGLVYIPVQETGMLYDLKPEGFTYKSGRWNLGTNTLDTFKPSRPTPPAGTSAPGIGTATASTSCLACYHHHHGQV